MKVLFLQDVMGTAYAGDIKEVKPGFARNFLLPQKLAVPATSDQMNRVKGLQAAASKRKEAAETDMKSLGDKLNGATITIQARAGRNDRLYGSITNANVAEEIGKLAGRAIDRRRLVMDPIRTLGTFTVPVKLFPGIEPKVKVAVVASGEAVEEPTAEEVIKSLEGEKKKPEAKAPEAAEEKAAAAS
jgi:large subunit ribosomal protein L9